MKSVPPFDLPAGPRLRRIPAPTILVYLALAGWLLAAPVSATGTFEWPHFRGPAHGGPAGAGALPSPAALEVAWKKNLGSGYSGIAVSGGKAITLYAKGADDLLAAFDAASGEPVWELRLGERYAGHDGSDDGPISTPAIDGGTVYALGPRGALVAAALASSGECSSTRRSPSCRSTASRLPPSCGAIC